MLSHSMSTEVASIDAVRLDLALYGLLIPRVRQIR